MHTNVGDRIHVHSRAEGLAQRAGEIVEVRGENGEQPYEVRFDDGHQGLICSVPDCVINPQH
ncbi:DUF1918 domain-containing protein [Streptomyces puniciscabiei]|uniref:DUF1918 domain-containing protein n=1 Tax=Streptomyces puniciscabiei TaxID=164348 RepID=UPI00379F9C9C